MLNIIGWTDLCDPAYVYLVISTMAITVMFLQNYFIVQNRFGSPDHNVYCLGSFSCDVSNVGTIFVIKIMYVLVWTWILNLICYAGAPGLSWLLVLLPFLLFFILLAQMFIFG
jgi:hypothetical protein